MSITYPNMPAPQAVTNPLPDADTNGVHDMIFELKDYTRRIHWWVRLFGVVWLVGLGFAVLAFIAIPVIALAGDNAESKFDDVDSLFDGVGSSVYSGSFDDCMSDPNTTWAECQNLAR